MRSRKITDNSSLSSEGRGVGTLWRCATPIVGVGYAKGSLKDGANMQFGSSSESNNWAHGGEDWHFCEECQSCGVGQCETRDVDCVE